MKKFLLLLATLTPLLCLAQEFTSNLPIVMIYTDTNPSTGKPYVIPDEPKVPGRMIVLWHKDGSRTSVADVDSSQYWNYNGKIGIERRGGGSTQNYSNKKNYGIKTMKNDTEDLNVSLLGMPKEHSWCLQGNVYEPALMRDVLTYDLFRDMGHYASRCAYCEVFLNDVYIGLYFLAEKIKVDENRVNIVKLKETDTDEKTISGGHLIVADHHHDANEPYQWKLAGGSFFHEKPEPEEITAAQHQFIVNYMNGFNTAVSQKNASIVDGYPSYIDLPSFVDYVIMQEFTGNGDGYRYSTFLYKERNGKLYAGPVWDHNISYGLVWFLRTDITSREPENWQYNHPNFTGDKVKFFGQLIEDSLFRSLLVKRWNELTQPGQVLNYESVMNRIAGYEALLEEAAPREIEKWKNEKYYHIKDHYKDLDSMKVWIKKRIDWISAQWPMDSSAQEVETPPLVISKIHYHPQDKNGYDQDDLEFIGITNNSNEPVDLTGIYFPVLGLSYIFPINSVLPPHKELFLASNAKAFEKAYGVAPFGEFTRNLSNKSQRLVLADAYGNTIDEVTYMDKSPWPSEADGKGYYLRLRNLNSDNALGENWVISKHYHLRYEEDTTHYGPSDKMREGWDTLGIAVDPTSITSYNNDHFILYPNPTTDNVRIQSSGTSIDKVAIYNMQGQSVGAKALQDGRFSVASLPQGLYLVKLYSNRQCLGVMKLVKK